MRGTQMCGWHVGKQKSPRWRVSPGLRQLVNETYSETRVIMRHKQRYMREVRARRTWWFELEQLVPHVQTALQRSHLRHFFYALYFLTCIFWNHYITVTYYPEFISHHPWTMQHRHLRNQKSCLSNRPKFEELSSYLTGLSFYSRSHCGGIQLVSKDSHFLYLASTLSGEKRLCILLYHTSFDFLMTL